MNAEIDGSEMVYRLYDAKGSLLYVGVTNDYKTRMRSHAEKSWWPEVRASRVVHYDTRQLAIEAEARAIREEHPIHNRAGVAGRTRRDIAPVPSVSVSGWLTIPEAAEYLKVSTKTIRRMIARAEIEARRIGPRLIRVNAETLLKSSREMGVW